MILESAALIRRLEKKANLFPFAKDKKIILAVYMNETSENKVSSNVFFPSDILDCLK
jgi:hypothetical protein